ncbi:uncharacterized protein LOC116434589 isoform X2 [Nomia melanderi]|uniref:uncharacterized protein LOC116434589 isoform X2 n=1 Tax=Nomia melanderi TaxID=2448451 RepID=UPI0013046757|nr:uncharacterized protein LOC116434589 isoform X2 [Nomia melanderi]
MKMNNSNNKELINLLDLLSDSDTDVSDLVLTPKKKKVKRKHRRGNAVKMKQGYSCGCGKSDLRIISLWLAAILVTFWLIVLSWLAFVFYGEIKKMDISIKSVRAGSEGVPDALQKCHSLSRDLQNNQTIIFTHLSDFKLQINNFTTQLAVIQRDLHQVEEWFKAAPELANVPTDLKALSSSVVSFGSQIQDLSATVKTLKESNARVQDAQATMQQNITSIKNTVTELSNVTQRPQMVTTNETKIKTDELNAAIVRLSNNLSHVNETLSRAVQWVAEDQKKDHETLVLLQETSQNVSMKVISLQRECVKTSVLTSVKKLSDQVAVIQAVNTGLNDRVTQLEQSHVTMRTSRNALLAEDSLDQKLIKARSLKESVAENPTAELNRDGSVSGETPAKKSSSKPERSIKTP